LDIEDPQGLLKNARVSGNKLDATVSDNTGHHQFFVKLKNPEVIVPVTLTIEPHFSASVKSAVYNDIDKTITANIVVKAPSMKENSGKLMIGMLGRQSEIAVNHTGLINQPVIFKTMDMPAGGVYPVEFTLQNKHGDILKTAVNTLLCGVDSAADRRMQEIRNKRTEFIDISGMRNSHSIFATSLWRWENVNIDCGVFKYFGDTIKTKGGIFASPKTNNTLVTIEYGRSDHQTAQTIRSEKPSILVFPVNKKIMNLSLFFISDVQSRNTRTEAGKIKLNYENGETTRIPLITGQNISMLEFSAMKDSELEPVNLGNWPGGLARVLQIPCDAFSTLTSFSIEINAADAQLGLIGVSVVYNL